VRVQGVQGVGGVDVRDALECLFANANAKYSSSGLRAVGVEPAKHGVEGCGVESCGCVSAKYRTLKSQALFPLDGAADERCGVSRSVLSAEC